MASGDGSHQRQRPAAAQQREQEVEQALQVEIAARRKQRAEAVLRQMLELDPAGQRFGQLLDLVDDPPGERGVGQERFPFVGQVGGEVGDDRMCSRGRRASRGLDRVSQSTLSIAQQTLDCAEGHDRDPPADLPLREDVEHIQPGHVKQEAGGQPDAVVGKARENEPDDHQPWPVRPQGRMT